MTINSGHLSKIGPGPVINNTFKTVEIDGKKIAYTDESDFIVQVGKRKGAYKTRYNCKGQPAQAMFYYNGLNIRAPYKKRLIVCGKTFCREIGT